MLVFFDHLPTPTLKFLTLNVDKNWQFVNYPTKFLNYINYINCNYFDNNYFDFSAGGKPVDADQEMVALGICNFMSSFVSAMPITGSFSRTAVNSASGVKTTFGCLWTGALVMLTLGLIMPYCAYIPKASLAAVIITAVIFSVEYEVIRPMWRSKSKFFFSD